MQIQNPPEINMKHHDDQAEVHPQVEGSTSYFDPSDVVNFYRAAKTGERDSTE